ATAVARRALPDLAAGLLYRGFRGAHRAGVIRRVHRSRVGGEWLQVQLVVALDQDLQRLLHRRGAVVLLDGALGTLCRGDIGAALVVVARYVHLVARQAVAQVDHPLQRIVCVLALRILLDHGLESGERLARRARRALGE